jgi:hypothetical protein
VWRSPRPKPHSLPGGTCIYYGFNRCSSRALLSQLSTTLQPPSHSHSSTFLMASTLCQFCERISIERLLRFDRSKSENDRIDHHRSLEAIHQSATNGCSFCRFLISDCLPCDLPETCAADMIQSSIPQIPQIPQIPPDLDLVPVWKEGVALEGISVIQSLRLWFLKRMSLSPRSLLELVLPSGTSMHVPTFPPELDVLAREGDAEISMKRSRNQDHRPNNPSRQTQS